MANTDKTPAKAEPVRLETSPAASQPAEQVLTEAVRNAELAALRKERDELRERLGGGADELVMLRAETDALRQAVARAGVPPRSGVLSEGVREELDRLGYAVDPGTGEALVRGEDGTVTATARDGSTRTVEAK